MTSTVSFFGNYGTITCDAVTGEVVSYVPQDDDEPSYSDIIKFDLDERRKWYLEHGKVLPDVQPDGDILDCGFWYKLETGETLYCAPEYDWREQLLDETKRDAFWKG